MLEGRTCAQLVALVPLLSPYWSLERYECCKPSHVSA